VIDWYRVVVDLHQVGYTAKVIAQRIGTTEARVRGWRQYGHEPRHHDGEALLSLWCAVTANMRESAPRCVENREPSRAPALCEVGHGERIEGQG